MAACAMYGPRLNNINKYEPAGSIAGVGARAPLPTSNIIKYQKVILLFRRREAWSTTLTGR